MNKKHLASVATTAGAALVWQELLGHDTTLHIHRLPPIEPFPLWGAQSIYGGTSAGIGVGFVMKQKSPS
ncbi:MAG TPA: hypothetical protein VK794_04775 [Steroidobacteraceae bacterium]|jgi:hypothetical protein|nr:hypothetical protein [Steroidobacteraceae bacterium]